LALLVNLTAKCTDLLGVSVGKATTNMWFRQEGDAADFVRQVW